MLENLVKKYQVFFEGLPEPVFYGRYYPMGHKEGSYQDELWDHFNYGKGLKKDKDPSGEKYREYRDEYDSDLRSLLNCVMQDTKKQKRGVVVIPSSKMGNVNRVTELVRETLSSNPGPFTNLTQALYRAGQRAAAHGGGDRSVAGNARTLALQSWAKLHQYDVILVIDDIVTSGNSFRAVGEVLRSAGFSGLIVNFAFARTFPSDGAAICLERRQNPGVYSKRYKAGRAMKRAERIDGLILDLDQTLLEDPIRDVGYEGNLWKSFGRDASPYRFYPGAEGLFELKIPIAVLSNRPLRDVEALLDDCGLPNSARCSAFSNPRAGLQAFSFPTEDSGGYTIRYYKPSPRGAEEAAEWIAGRLNRNVEALQVMGVGNTEEDIIAYEAAGMESALALWGVPEYLRGYAREHWGADYVFGEVQELVSWCRNRATYFETAAYYDGEGDSARAIEYYDLALSSGERVMEASFRLAYLLAEEDPARAAKLYETAIEEGDEYASTNNLAQLVEKRDPERAKSLYERAIAAGNLDIATRNLALLIAEESPEKAVKLLEQAAEAGNKQNLAGDLERIALAGCPDAVRAYREHIAKDDDAKESEFVAALSKAEPEKAKALLQTAIDDGDEAYATRGLALLVMEEEPDRAMDLLERAARAGNASNLITDLKQSISDGNERAIQLAEDLVISKDGKRAFDLALIVAERDKTRAKELYEQAIAAGDEYGSTCNLANLIADEDPERAKSLYERAIAAGEERYSPNNLANMIASDDPERAISLYERSIAAGDTYYATRNLALMVIGDDPNRAVDLLKQSAEAGNAEHLEADLSSAIRRGNPKAIELYEREVVARDESKALNLADMISAVLPERTKAKQLYKRAIAAGDERYATFGLANLIQGDDPAEAEKLFERSIAAGDSEWATNNLGALIVSRDPERARSLFEQSLEAGDEIYAACNLAHTLIPTDAAKAIELYELSLGKGDETEAKLGLAYLLKDSQPERANDLVEQALAAPNMNASFDFLVRVLSSYDKDRAVDAVRYYLACGYSEASDALIALAFGDGYEPEAGVALFGTDVESGNRIPWLVLGDTCDGVLLLSKNVIRRMPFVENASEATWEGSAVRPWLNGPFKEQCFDAGEIAMMVPHPDLGDLLFCISEAELSEYMRDEAGKLKAADCKTQEKTKWWLRPDKGGTLSAPCVDEAGKKSWSLALVELGVRPAIIIALR